MNIHQMFFVSVAGIVLSSCASQKEIVTESPADQTEKRVHTQEELSKTGETEIGPALGKTDAAIQTSHRP